MEAGTLRQPRVWLPVVAGVGVAVCLGVYGRLHEPAGALDVPAFIRLQDTKVWLATAAAALGVIQLVSALAMYGKLPTARWIPGLHRWSGRLALLFSLPVAVHCLYALGFRAGEPRVLAHSLLGCVFYGAFAAKMLLISRPGEGRPWVVPLAGGLVLTTLTGLWLSSALWFFTTFGPGW
ncbi:DUF6529 family protein [Actinoplanes sp. GCM10030250]|uniref:DUF6529 family protein n=1 Tax=Actinoplanes sp. GCM10030250 TaxID=3273376 RepID=UPI003612A437